MKEMKYCEDLDFIIICYVQCVVSTNNDFASIILFIVLEGILTLCSYIHYFLCMLFHYICVQ